MAGPLNPKSLLQHPRALLQHCTRIKRAPFNALLLRRRQEKVNALCTHCAMNPPSRRSAIHTALLMGLLACHPQTVQAMVASSEQRQGLGRYIKKKKLDPLESYVPAVIAARNQLKKAGSIMKDDLQSARQLLRVGPFDGLRENVKALGEYAEQQGVKDSKKLVDDFFLKVQDFDFTLFQAKRYERPVKEDSEAALERTIAALNKLLATVPQSIVDGAERIVQNIEESSQSQPAAPKEEGDQQLDQLVQLVPG